MYTPNKEIVLKEHVMSLVLGGKETKNITIETSFRLRGHAQEVVGQKALVAVIDRGEDKRQPSVSVTTVGQVSYTDAGALIMVLAEYIKEGSSKLRMDVIEAVTDLLEDKDNE